MFCLRSVVSADFILPAEQRLPSGLGIAYPLILIFFSSSPIKRNLLAQVESIFSDRKINVRVNNSGELTLLLNSVKVTFLHYPFTLLFPLEEFNGIKIASTKEIAAMKAYTIGRRGSFKDYIDLYFILHEQIDSLSGIIGNASKKYGDIFDPRLFLEQLRYMKDIEDKEIRFLKKEISEGKLEKFFAEKIKEIKL